MRKAVVLESDEEFLVDSYVGQSPPLNDKAFNPAPHKFLLKCHQFNP